MQARVSLPNTRAESCRYKTHKHTHMVSYVLQLSCPDRKGVVHAGRLNDVVYDVVHKYILKIEVLPLFPLQFCL